jgi:RNA polymerase sigma factor (sigma-70 family)
MTRTPNEQDYLAMLRENEAALMRLARHYAGPEDRHDLLQEMHLQLWRSFAEFAGRSERATWVYRVALNTALGYRRKPVVPMTAVDHVPDHGDSGSPRDTMDVLAAFLATLDPLQRAVLMLDLEGLEREQIAEITGLSPNAIAIRMTRLRQAFETQFLEQN